MLGFQSSTRSKVHLISEPLRWVWTYLLNQQEWLKNQTKIEISYLLGQHKSSCKHKEFVTLRDKLLNQKESTCNFQDLINCLSFKDLSQLVNSHHRRLCQDLTRPSLNTLNMKEVITVRTFLTSLTKNYKGSRISTDTMQLNLVRMERPRMNLILLLNRGEVLN